MALRRRKNQPSIPMRNEELEKHIANFVANYDIAIARQGAEIEQLKKAVDRLADKVSACMTAVANRNTPPTPKRATSPAPAAKKTSKSPKHNKVYTADEIALILMLREQGSTFAQIGAALNRSGRAVEQLFRSRLNHGDTAVRPRNTTRDAR